MEELDMGLEYKNLDDRTRTIMLAEIEHDITAGTLYLSDNLSSRGKTEYPDLLREASKTGTDLTFGIQIRSRLNPYEKPRQLKSGEFSKPPIMRDNAHEMLGEGQFNCFYIRAICVRAIEDKLPGVFVYRAKPVQNPRPESEQKIGQSVSPQLLLNDLRANKGINTALGLPAGPNSGLSVRLP
jgi:hypothetical protein